MTELSELVLGAESSWKSEMWNVMGLLVNQSFLNYQHQISQLLLCSLLSVIKLVVILYVITVRPCVKIQYVLCQGGDFFILGLSLCLVYMAVVTGYPQLTRTHNKQFWRCMKEYPYDSNDKISQDVLCGHLLWQYQCLSSQYTGLKLGSKPVSDRHKRLTLLEPIFFSNCCLQVFQSWQLEKTHTHTHTHTKKTVTPNLESSSALQMRLLAKSLNITVPCPLASK